MRERDAAVAAFVARAPELSREERQVEIECLRREHGYTVLAHDVARQLMELPEPAAAHSDAPLAARCGARLVRVVATMAAWAVP